MDAAILAAGVEAYAAVCAANASVGVHAVLTGAAYAVTTANL